MNRRDVLRYGAAGLLGALFPYADAALPNGGKPPFKLLYSNDLTNIFSCVSPYHRQGEAFRPAMLQASVDEAADADLQFLQPGLGWTAWWQSKVDPPQAHYDWFHKQTGLAAPSWLKYLLDGGDYVSIFAAQCRKRNVAPVISLRMNDAHHTYGPLQAGLVNVSRFYVEHPELQVGADLPPDHPRNSQTAALDWSHDIVRTQKFRLLEELAETYDIDGLELDFMRYPSYFNLRKTNAAERVAIMTGFVASIRQLLDRTARSGQHRYLSVRVPSFVDAYEPLGLELNALRRSGVDIFNVSSFFFMEQQTDIGALHKIAPDAPLYFEMCNLSMISSPLTTKGGDDPRYLRVTDEQFYTGADLAYRRGATGISLFNFVYYRQFGAVPELRGPFSEPPFHILPHLKDPDWLAHQAQWYVLAREYGPPGKKLPLPASLAAGDSLDLTLDIALPLRSIDRVLARLRTENPAGGRWTLSVNHHPASPVAPVLKPLPHDYDAFLGTLENYACFEIEPGRLHDGVNEIEMQRVDGATATLEYVDLTIA
jgi:hypothetical protein